MGGFSGERKRERSKRSRREENNSPKIKGEAMRARGLRYGALTPLPAVSQKKPDLQISTLSFWGKTL